MTNHNPNQKPDQNSDRDDQLAPKEKAQAGKNSDDQNRKQKEDKQNKEDSKSQSGRN